MLFATHAWLRKRNQKYDGERNHAKKTFDYYEWKPKADPKNPTKKDEIVFESGGNLLGCVA